MIGKVDEINGQKTITPLSGSDKQEIFDVVYPIGCTYVQYPQQKSPNTLFNSDSVTSEWEALNYSGAFFRSNGGNAKAFVEEGGTLSLQTNQNKYHNHGVTDPGHGHGITQNNHSHTYTCDANVSGSWGSLSGQSASGTGGGAYASTQGAKADLSINSATTSISIKYNGSSSDQEARPDNYTIKIWKRIA